MLGKQTNLSVLRCRLGFIGSRVHARRGRGDRRGGGFFHHICRHLLLCRKYPTNAEKLGSTGCKKKYKKGKRNKGCELRLCQLAAIQSALALREEKKKNEKEGKKRKNVLSSSLESGSDAMRCARRQRLPGRRMRLRACVRVCECRRPSACGCYLYRPLHANGSCETSQTFFPTVTSHQSGRGTRGPEGGRTDGSWSAPSHWSPPPCSRWRPMAHSREGGEEG